MKVLVVGCGLGGLSCAISCLQEGLEVEILEKAARIGEIGAGIQVPPNATRVMHNYGVVERLQEVGAVKLDHHDLCSYSTGEVITTKPGEGWSRKQFGHDWYVIHRADYHRVLSERASELGAEIRTGCNVVHVDFESPSVLLDTGERISADIVVGADGLWSTLRDKIVGGHEGPVETGDMAFRAIIPRQRIEELDDPDLLSFVDTPASRNWSGPSSHAVLYPMKNNTVFNLVLIRPDDLPSGVSTATADVQEMRDAFENWDPRLAAVISRVDTVLKWRILHMRELNSWTRGSVALLGDASHAAAPYAAQGAAMAVEDGATLGVLLGCFNKSPLSGAKDREARISEILRLYEHMRKARTTLIVEYSKELRVFFHLPDGPAADAHNAELQSVDWHDANAQCSWGYGDLGHLKSLMGFDAIGEAKTGFARWFEEQQQIRT